MSSTDVLQPNENSITSLENINKVSVPSDEAPLITKIKQCSTADDGSLEDDEKPQTIQMYTMKELLELRTIPASLRKPSAFLEEFFNKDNVWDPEAWHKSKASRSSSPAVVDGKPILEEKKNDFYDDDIELAPRRESFRQGCQVKASQINGLNRPNSDRKSRLTGRAANQRRSVETNYKDGDSISERTQEFEKMRKDKEGHFMDRSDRFHDRNDRFQDHSRFQDRGYRQNDKSSKNKGYSNDRDDYKGSKNNHNNHHHERSGRVDSMPEWMTDGPTSQLDTIELLTCKDIEAEKKAFAKKNKKVRISPDVETQEIMKVSKSSKRKSPLTKQDSNKQRKPSEKNSFEIDDFFQKVEYYPPEMFREDQAYGDGVKSRFTQYFQQRPNQPGTSNSRSSSVSLSSNDPLLPDEVFTGQKPPQQPYFTPIQPAPALLSAAATAHAVQTSNIATIIQKQKDDQLSENLKKAEKEVRGRLNVEELEAEAPTKHSSETPPVKAVTNDKSAFNMFLKTMKDAGQLPEKPSPVVSGLPVHLLPQPPTRTSPIFEKLKRSLSRSPSPKEFVKAVSTVAGILSTNPSIDRELSLLQRKNSSRDSPIVGSCGDITQTLDQTLDQTLNKDHVSNHIPKTQSSDYHGQKGSFMTPPSQIKKKPKNAFTPTSVLKKMHNDRKEDCSSPSSLKEKGTEPDVSSVSISASSKYPDVLPEQVRGGSKSSKTKIQENLDEQFTDAAATPDRSRIEDIFTKSGLLPFHSAPPTPRNEVHNIYNGNETSVSLSAPGTPDHQRHGIDPPNVRRYPMQPTGNATRGSAYENDAVGWTNNRSQTILMTPSAFQSVEKDSQKSVGVIGSGVPQKPSEQIDLMEKLEQLNVNDRSSPRQQGANPKLAPGNGVSLRPSRSLGSPSEHSPMLLNPLQQLANQQHQQITGVLPQQPSQQQQLLQAQRRAQIQQAQLLQQQKLREIANQANQQNPTAHHTANITNASRPLLPDPEKSSQKQQQRQRPLYQQNQHQQLLAYQQQQKQQQQQMLAQHHRQFHGQSAMPFAHRQMGAPGQTQPHLPMPLQQAGLSPFQQAPLNSGFANVSLTAQALVQQQLISQARARFIQAQLLQQQPQVVQAALMAQAALVRGQAQAQAAMMLNPRTRHALAGQMGLRQQFNQNKLPQHPGISHNPGSDSTMQNSKAVGENMSGNVLSKWFSNDVLQQLPASKTPKPADLGSAQVLSVEELERRQQSAKP